MRNFFALAAVVKIKNVTKLIPKLTFAWFLTRMLWLQHLQSFQELWFHGDVWACPWWLHGCWWLLIYSWTQKKLGHSGGKNNLRISSQKVSHPPPPTPLQIPLHSPITSTDIFDVDSIKFLVLHTFKFPWASYTTCRYVAIHTYTHQSNWCSISQQRWLDATANPMYTAMFLASSWRLDFTITVV